MGEWGSSLKRNLILVLLTAFLGSFGLGSWQFFRFNDGKLHLVFCDVGQGDAILLRTPDGKEALIDGGPDEKVLDCLAIHQPFYDRQIDVMVLSHPQADHLTGLIAVLKRYKVDYLVVENIFAESAVFAQFRQEVAGKGIEIYNPKSGDRLHLGETELNFYWPQLAIGDKNLWSEEGKSSAQILAASSVSGDSNNYSLVFAIKYKDFVALETGDAENQILLKAITSPLGVTVLKVPHHGSKKSLSGEVLNLLNPKLAVISVGEKNRFGHPATETLEILKNFGTPVYRTDQNGEGEFVTDGKSWWQIK